MRYLQFLNSYIEYPKLLYKWLWLVITKRSNDLKPRPQPWLRPRLSLKDHGNNDQGHGKAMAKDHINLPRRKHELES